MTGLHPRGEEAEGGNDFQVQSVADRHQGGSGPGVEVLDLCIIPRIDLHHATLFQDDFGLEVTEFFELVSKGLPLLPGGHHPKFVVAAEFVAADLDHFTRAALVGKGIPAGVHGELRHLPQFVGTGGPLALSHHCPGHRYFGDGILGQGNADGVADPVVEERSDPDGGLDPAVLAISGFRHAEVDRVVPVPALLLQSHDEEAVGLDHDLGIGGLHREDDLVVIEIAGDADKLEGALHHAQGRVPVAVHDAVGERTVVCSDTHGTPQFLAELHERNELEADPCEFLVVVRVRVVTDFEFLPVGVVPGIDPDLLHPPGGLKGGVGLEVDVGHEGHLASGRPHPVPDVLQVSGILAGLGGDAHNLASRLCQLEDLPDAGPGIAGVGRDHGLDPDRVFAAHPDLADHHFP